MRRTTRQLPAPRRILAATAAAAALAFASAPLAVAAPGDNGDVKIHDSATAVDSQNNDPQVCQFYLDAFNFDTITLVSWTIEQQQPTGNALVLAGALVLTNGTGSTSNYSLPDGHYQLTWTFVGENGSAKHKTFMVRCASGSPTATGSPTSTASPISTASPSAPPSGSPSPSPSPSPTPGTHGGSPSLSPKPHPVGGVGTGGGGTSGPNTGEVLGGAALIATAGWFGVRSLRRRSGRNAES
ncbi:hypothetical protein [Kitasatospora sp. NPDC090091]|uniref:hypothetical protein n=1 Tax=Kitasatospora sp. NPDC090091 TaxID=3364081 RepID=UPI003816FDF4